MALWHLFLSDLIDAVFPATDSVPSDRNHQEVFSSLHPEEEMPKDRVQGVSITGGSLVDCIVPGIPSAWNCWYRRKRAAFQENRVCYG